MFRKILPILCASSALALGLLSCAATSGNVVIEWKDVHQQIDGFGASCADSYEPLPSQMADFFFTTSGIGLSLLRAQVVASAVDCKTLFGADGGTCADNPLGATTLLGELAIAKQAVARGVTVWSTPWTPPASMKSNSSAIKGGSLLRADYSAWAAAMAGYVKFMNANGVPIYAISVQNEPDIAQDYGSAIYTAQEFRDFVPVLHSALQAAGAGSTKIMIAEASQWNLSSADFALSDSSVAPDIDIIAAHGYGKQPIVAPANHGKRVWQTEDSSQSPNYDGSIYDALSWASKIHTYLTVANVNAWHWWFLSDGPKYGNGTDNAALTDIKLKYPKRAYVIGQWSKFVRPSWSRIGVSYQSSSLQVSAFKDSQNQSFAIVVVNSGNKSVSQTFSMNGFASTSVIPWITSSKLSLASQAAVQVSGASFTYSLPALSVTTFVGTASN
jgi:glucuronoarabinoxylan endo-1,4-beta-xylanase